MNEFAPVIRLTGLTKRFGAVTACKSISFEVRAGEVHCLLGENGAGKSTLIAMLAGQLQPSSGAIEFDGAAVTFTSPAAAIARGVSVVYQHSTLVPTMTVLENLMLAGDGLALDRAGAERRLAELNEVSGATIRAEQLVSQLALGQQQQIEIARAMWRRPRLLILDEPTSMLSETEAAMLSRRVAELAARGVAIVFVTHSLREALTLADAVTVLRSGRVVEHISRDALRISSRTQLESRVLTAMFGGDLPSPGTPGESQAFNVSAPLPVPVAPDAPERLRLEGVSTASGDGVPVTEIDFGLGAGEVLGIAGIDGHGQRHLAEAIAGQRAVSQGRVFFSGVDITREAPRSRIGRGLHYLTDDRLGEGTIARLSVASNLLLKRVGERPLWRFGVLDHLAARREAAALVATYDIRPPQPEASAGTLSGGNIQKLLLARELSNSPRVVVFCKPSYGFDLQTVRKVRDAIRRFVDSGGAVLLISTDLDELTELSHRIAVLSRGRLVGEIENTGDGVREHIGALVALGRSA